MTAHGMTPRPYQLRAKSEVYRAFRRGSRSALVVAATGLGKGAIIGMIVGDMVKAGKRVLVFVHRREIVDQLAGHVRTWAGLESAIEQADRADANASSKVVVGSVQSIVRRFDRFPADRFDVLIYDEAHHALGAQPRAIFDHFESARIVGLTATPNRGDELALAQVFDEVAFEMPIDEAIREGWLAPYRTVRHRLGIDFGEVRKRHGDLMAGDLGAILSQTDALREAVGHALHDAARLKTLVFTCTRPHMHLVHEMIESMVAEQGLDLPAAWLDGTTPRLERERIFADFRAGRLRWLVGVDVFSEGVDVPDVQAVCVMRPTMSRVIFTQQRGRGVRPLPGTVDGVTAASMLVRLDKMMADGEEPALGPWAARAVLEMHAGSDAAARRLAIALSDKPECLVIDFTDSSDRLALASDMDALGGDYELPEQREAEALLASGDASNLLDALEQARSARERRHRLARARNGDPFALWDIPRRRDRYGRAPTRAHMRVLDPLALPIAQVDWRQANDLCAEISRREGLDLCMYEQAFALARGGHDVEALPAMSRRDAAAALWVGLNLTSSV